MVEIEFLEVLEPGDEGYLTDVAPVKFQDFEPLDAGQIVNIFESAAGKFKFKQYLQVVYSKKVL